MANNDISANYLYGGDFIKALKAIRAHSIIISCNQDLYFPAADNIIEADYIKNVKLCIYNSPFGHCVANLGNDPAFDKFLDKFINELLA